jgi:hypothetical protein
MANLSGHQAGGSSARLRRAWEEERNVRERQKQPADRNNRLPWTCRGRSRVLVLPGGPYVVNFFHELPGLVKVLLRGLQSLMQDLLKLGGRMLFEDL